MNKKGDSNKVDNQDVKGCQHSSLTVETENVNQESFIRQKIVEARDKLEKQKQDNRKKELDLLMIKSIQNTNLLANLTIGDSIDFSKMIDEKIKEIDAKIASLN
ncbi:uncharacterized protein LOC127097787 isoform X2 [Lathyrus oleraceus]|uniref:Uncharacterized protein n=1 Tax=Pisum sativum TaxID=3888 RepID=A0A9D5A6N3_PEA|nr:uncharacterized protein LOC127097787 isoform X2 [Pisum sativum]KAI5397011.1 hypothetical protein KIW84_063004 [Pisum sativum]